MMKTRLRLLSVLAPFALLLSGCDVLSQYLDSISDGAACTADTDCLGGKCLTAADGFTGGYCTTAQCETSGCSNLWGAECLPFESQGNLCFETCSEDVPCRDGYSCLAVESAQVCLPNGLSDTYSAAGTVGAPCGNASECATGTCLTNFVDGYCSALDCESAADCGAGGVCLATNEDATASACFKACETNAQCRFGYTCQSIEGGSGGACVELPQEQQTAVRNPNGAADGEPCAADINCRGGTCLRGNSDDQFPGGYCTSLACADLGCNAPAGKETVCRVNAKTTACYIECARDADCRDGYSCLGIVGGAGYCGTERASTTPPTGGGTQADVNIVCESTSVSGGRAITFDVSPGAVAFAVTPYSNSETVRPSRLRYPDGSVAADFNTDYRFMDINPQILLSVTPVFFPAAPQFQEIVESGGGRFTLELETADTNPCFYVLEKSSLGSAIDLNIYLVGVPQTTASNAAQNSGLQTMLSTFRRIYSGAGITLRTVRYYDITGNDLASYRVIRNFNDLFGLASLSRDPGPSLAERLSVNVFLIQGFDVPDAPGLLGMSLGIPGVPGFHGNEGAGLIFTSEYLGDNPAMTGQTLAHEIGHYLGLRHTTEHGGSEADPLDDTPRCSNPDNGASCPDASNFMFPFSLGNNQEGVSSGQSFVLRHAPLTQ
jgi:hypothetical protein